MYPVPLSNATQYPWPTANPQGYLNIYELAAGLPSTVLKSEEQTWANLTADGSICEEMITYESFEKNYPKALPFNMKYDPSKKMIKGAWCDRSIFPFRNMYMNEMGGVKSIYTKTAEPMGYHGLIMII